jgi:hypothetical protein
MTERLSSLLHDEADTLLIPTPPADAVLRQGHGLRRRRRLTTGAAVLGVLAVVGTGVALTVDREPSGNDAGVASTTSSYVATGAFSVGRTVHLGPQGAPSVTMEEDVHSLHYTSAGVLVRTNQNFGASDGSGEEHYTLIRPDGSTKKLDVTTAEQAVSTDPTEPYLAFARLEGTTASAIVVDITTGEQVRVELPVPYGRSGWSAPPVSLDGDHVYVGMGSAGVYDVNWRTGHATPIDLNTTFPEVHGGRTVLAHQDEVLVVDVATGERLRRIAINNDNWVLLSPDGRWAREGATVYDVASDSELTLPGSADGYGWSPDGHLFRLDGDELVVCDPTTGSCERKPLGFTAPDPNASESYECDDQANCVPDGTDSVRLGGVSYES